MVIVGLVLAAAAAAFHVFIFALESLKWTEPATRKIFGVPSEADAITMKGLAFNQGFYNLFLAIAAILGIVLTAVGQTEIGLTLVLTGTASMAAAALVLLISSPDKASAAIKQGTLPLLSVLLIALSFAF